MFSVWLIENALFSWDFHHDILGDVDLHQDHHLMEGSEDSACKTEIDPFVSIHAENMLLCVFVVLLVEDVPADEDTEERQKSENEVRLEEAVCLFFKKFLVVAETVW